MSNQSVLRSSQAVAKELDISPATLRRWSDEFADYLSIGAGSSKSGSHRRYTDNDVLTLIVIKEMMNNGMTYEQVRQNLNGHTADDIPNSPSAPESRADSEFDYSTLAGFERINAPDNDEDNASESGDRAIVAISEGSPAIAFLTNTLATLSDSQKSILNSQAANRELLGVLLQDNFNLKEENSRLRERILEVERGVAQNRQEDEWRREALRQELESKISAANQLAMEAISTARSVETPQIKAVENKPGCLGVLFGRGSTQIVTVPQRRKKVEGHSSDQLQGLSPAGPQPPSTAVQQRPPNHPKPLFPPE